MSGGEDAAIGREFAFSMIQVPDDFFVAEFADFWDYFDCFDFSGVIFKWIIRFIIELSVNR